MDREINYEYPNCEYPVCVRLIEANKHNSCFEYDGVRPLDMEILLVENGCLEIESPGETYKICKGQGITIRRGSYRRIIRSECESTSFYSLIFRPEFVIVKQSCSPMTKKYYTDLMNAQEYLVMTDETIRDEKSLSRVRGIIEANMLKTPGFELLTKGNLALMWVSMLERLQEPKVKYTGKNVPSREELRVIEAKQYIDENFAEDLSLEVISDKIHVSRNECCREFKRVLGVTPVDYLIRRRIFEAAKVICKNPLSTDSVSELAINVGFNTISYFNRMFKRLMDCTPTEFAADLKTENSDALKKYKALEVELSDKKLTPGGES